MNPSNKTAASWSSIYAVIILFFVLTLFLYQPTVLYLNDIWSDISIGEYAHGYLVLAICAYLIYKNRHNLKNTQPVPSYAVLPLLSGSIVLWLAAMIVDVEVAQTLALLLIIFTSVWALLGHSLMKKLAFPILFIIFAIPVWFPLSPHLQELSADVVFWIVRLIDIPAYREGSRIVVPSGAFSIEEACSGLRYLLAALTLGSLYAYLNYVSTAARIAVVLVAAATAILANILRVFIVVYLGYATEMQHPWVADHLMLGWYLFGGLVAILLFLDARFYKHGVSVNNNVDTETADVDQTGNSRGHGFIGISVITFILLCSGPAVIYLLDNQQQSAGSAISINLPGENSGWSEQTVSSNDWMPQYAGALTYKSEHMVHGQPVSVFVAYYPVQKQGVEVINDLNRISNTKQWKTRFPHPRTRSFDGVAVLEQQIENERNQKLLLWYWYNIGGKITTNKYEAKVLQLVGTLSGQPQAYMAAVSIPVEDEVADTRRALQKVYMDLQQPLAELSIIE